MTDLYADPFSERASEYFSAETQLMGARLIFESSSRRLLQLIRAAYHGLPRHRFPGPLPHLRVRLFERPEGRLGPMSRGEPAELGMFSGQGWLGAASVGSDLVVMSPRERTAVIGVSSRTLRSSYHARYELIDFAVFTLVSRCLRLSPLHAACVGISGRGVLLMGGSGSGKSTLTMLSLMQGFDFLAEDSVFVAPRSLLATGIGNYLHVRADSLKWVSPTDRAALRASPVIRRRSGVRKFEVDLRTGGHRLAPRPLKITAVVFLTAQAARANGILRPLTKRVLLSRLASEQAYAVNLPGWHTFTSNLSKLPAYELRRGTHPDESVQGLRGLLTESLESGHA